MAMKKADILSCKETIDHGGEFRVHLSYSRGGTVTARLWHPDGHKVGSAGGGGYDKQGTALANAVELFFQEELLKLPLPEYEARADGRGRHHLSGFRALSEYRGTRRIDGSAGLECVCKILIGLGFPSVREFATGKDAIMILAEGRTPITQRSHPEDTRAEVAGD